MKNKKQRFSHLTHGERIESLVANGVISKDEGNQLKNGLVLHVNLAENLIENALGYYQIPLGVAVNFIIDKKEYVIPMAIEETSVIAAASKTAKWIAQQGHIKTSISGDTYIGQMHYKDIKNIKLFTKLIEKNKTKLIQEANATIAKNMVKRGGGVKDIKVRAVSHEITQKEFIILHVYINTCNAMGANFINQICEYLKKPIERLTNEQAIFAILTNLTDSKLTEVEVVINDIDPALAIAIEYASLMAYLDPYRAATNNKGIMNGVDAVLLATGNDWRCVEAAIHAYAVKDNQYRSLSFWHAQGNTLTGKLIAPISVGTVGGITNVHPTAKLALKILKVKDANELSRVVAAVGLVQNLGAIRALVSDGICNGHMKLHLTNYCLRYGCKEEEINKVKLELQTIIQNKGYLSSQDIKDLLKKRR